MIVNKLDAAARQLNVAVRLFFAAQDLIAVHTLVGAASVILSDLVEIRKPDDSWDRNGQLANHLSPKIYYRIARKTQSFFKHATFDPNETLDFETTETEGLIICAILNCGELQQLSIEMSVFQLWYLATRADVLGDDYPYVKESLELFPGTRGLRREEQIALGRKVLEKKLLEPAA
jgi:hypothetical protein